MKIFASSLSWSRLVLAFSLVVLSGCAQTPGTPADSAPALTAPTRPDSSAPKTPAIASPAPTQPVAAVPATTPAGKPTLYVISDSTAKNTGVNGNGLDTKGQPVLGWGMILGSYFDPAKIRVVNDAIAGRSSRSFIAEGHWDPIVNQLKPGDVVLLQWGHNDGGTPSAMRAGDRPSLPGLGEESGDYPTPAGTTATVHTYGWYMRKYIADVKAKGATIIVLTPTVRNNWPGGVLERELGKYGGWAMDVAQSQNVPMVDMNSIVADQYIILGQDKIPPLYSAADTTHSSPAGADLNASSIVSGLKALPGNPVGAYLSEKGTSVVPSDKKYVTENARVAK